MDNKDFVWVEKYRPKNVSDCILPDRIKKTFLEFVDQKTFPNLLLSGGAGTGKTTVARALLEELDYEYLFLNASKERNIGTVRTTITDFASTMSLSGSKKAIILDEADGLTPEAQDSLRAAIEEFKHVRFVLTCNFKNKLIAALQSRTSTVEFNIRKDEKQDVMSKFMKRVVDILKAENVTADAKAVATIIKKHFPDNRRILNELQRYSVGGKLDASIIDANVNGSIPELIAALKGKDFGAMRQWVANNTDVAMGTLYRDIYDGLYSEIVPEAVPQLTILIGEYDYRSNFVANQEINTSALLASIMGSIAFK